MDLCIYCGAIATERDHLKARALNGPGHLGYGLTRKSRPQTVPACAECNNNLGAFASDNVRERAAYLYERYSRKHRKKARIELERLKWLRGVALLDYLEV